MRHLERLALAAVELGMPLLRLLLKRVSGEWPMSVFFWR